MNFCAMKIEDGYEYAVTFEAPNWEIAQLICDEQNWILQGEFKFSLSGISREEANKIIYELNKNHKHKWVQ